MEKVALLCLLIASILAASSAIWSNHFSKIRMHRGNEASHLIAARTCLPRNELLIQSLGVLCGMK